MTYIQVYWNNIWKWFGISQIYGVLDVLLRETYISGARVRQLAMSHCDNTMIYKTALCTTTTKVIQSLMYGFARCIFFFFSHVCYLSLNRLLSQFVNIVASIYWEVPLVLIMWDSIFINAHMYNVFI